MIMEISVSTRAQRPIQVVYRFGPFRLEGRNGPLYRNDELVSIAPRTLQVLWLLVARAGSAVSKDDLIAEVWEGCAVEENNITKNVALLRKVLRSGFGNDDSIRTIPKVGYQFMAPVKETGAFVLAEPEAELPIVAAPRPERSLRTPWRVALAGALSVAVALALALRTHPARPSRHSVAVLGVRDLSPDPSTRWLGTAIAETLSSDLSTAGGLRTIPEDTVARTRRDFGIADSAEFNPGQLKRAQNALGFDLVVTGSYLAVGPDVRLNIMLRDAATGEQRAAFSETGSQANLLELLAHAGAALRSGAGVPPGPGADQNVVAAKPEVLRLYAEGLDRLRVMDGPGAQQMLVQATAAQPDFAPAHAALSQAWSLMGFDTRARDEAQLAMKNSGSLPREERLRIEARYFESIPDWPKAIDTWRALWRVFSDDPQYGNRLAAALTDSGKAKEALDVIDRLRQTSPGSGAELRPPADNAELFLVEAAADRAVSDFRASLRASQQAIEISRAHGARSLEMRSLLSLGEAHMLLGQGAAASDEYEQAKQIAASLDDKTALADALGHQGTLLRERGDVAGAEAASHQALETYEAAGDRRGTMRVLETLGNLARSHADFAQARAMFERSVAIARETGAAPIEVIDLVNIGNILLNTGDSDGARNYYQQAMTRAAEIGQTGAQGTSLGNIAVVDYTHGHLENALREELDSLKLARQTGEQARIIYRLGYLSRMSITMGDLPAARRYMDEYASLLKRGSNDSAEFDMLEAELRLEERRTVDEGRLLQIAAQGAQARSPARASHAWRDLGYWYLSRHDLTRARKAADQATAFASKSANIADWAIPAALLSARVSMAEHQYAPARAILVKGLQDCRRINHRVHEMDFRLSLGEAEMLAGDAAGRSDLTALAQEATQLKFGGVVRQADRFLSNPR